MWVFYLVNRSLIKAISWSSFGELEKWIPWFLINSSAIFGITVAPALFQQACNLYQKGSMNRLTGCRLIWIDAVASQVVLGCKIMQSTFSNKLDTLVRLSGWYSSPRSGTYHDRVVEMINEAGATNTFGEFYTCICFLFFLSNIYLFPPWFG